MASVPADFLPSARPEVVGASEEFTSVLLQEQRMVLLSCLMMVANDNDLYFDDDDGDEPLMLEDEAGLAEVLEAYL